MIFWSIFPMPICPFFHGVFEICVKVMLSTFVYKKHNYFQEFLKWWCIASSIFMNKMKFMSKWKELLIINNNHISSSFDSLSTSKIENEWNHLEYFVNVWGKKYRNIFKSFRSVIKFPCKKIEPNEFTK